MQFNSPMRNKWLRSVLWLVAGTALLCGLAWLTGAIDRTKIALLTRKAPAQDQQA